MKADKAIKAGHTACRRNDYKTALKIWRPLAMQGNAKAQFLIGFLYSGGKGVKKDYAEAMNWFRKAADQRYIDAQKWMAYMYETGFCGKRNYAEAVKWYRKAAAQGDTESQRMLSVMYSTGRGGLKKDHAAAAKWLRKAAKRGDINSQWHLAQSYRKGRGVKLDLVKAYFWLSLATAKDDDGGARELRSVTRKMTPAQIAKVQRGKGAKKVPSP
ncbi:MAG: tetratricopeptide repeat protein [Alphaproteobacteria bacterium]